MQQNAYANNEIIKIALLLRYCSNNEIKDTPMIEDIIYQDAGNVPEKRKDWHILTIPIITP